MNILIVGQGGREHALAWCLAQEGCHTLYFAPGNAGMAPLGQRLDIDVLDINGLALFAAREKIDLTVVGPEQPLAQGIVDEFQHRGLLIFGPSQQGAQIESSKAYAKALMAESGIPTASYTVCEQAYGAIAALSGYRAPFVIKEDGLAAGKGVSICQTRAEAEIAIQQAFEKGMSVVIESFLRGQELSVLAICDGKQAIPMVAAQDFKKAGDGDSGPNTGGMGAYAPVPFVTPALMDTIQTQVFSPLMALLQEKQIDYRGVLYAGLMIDEAGQPHVIEFNARFGDPETQVVLPLLDDPLSAILMASAEGDLSPYAKGFRFKPHTSAVTVVLASQGYPGAYEAGQPLSLLTPLPENTLLFHAGTKCLPDGSVVSNGGRVLNATGLGETLSEARQNAYILAKQACFANGFYRTDIALSAIEQENTAPENTRQLTTNP